jgi:hypothetical protein
MVHPSGAKASIDIRRALYCAPMIRTTTLALAFVLVAGAASAGPKCGIFGTACMKIQGSDGQVQLNTFEGAIEGSKGTWDHGCSENGRTTLMAHCRNARISKCERIADSKCDPNTGVVRVEFNGICDLKLGDLETAEGNFKGVVVDYPACDSIPDTYSIVIRSGPWIGKGDVVYEAEGAMECGGLRISAPAGAVKKKK